MPKLLLSFLVFGTVAVCTKVQAEIVSFRAHSVKEKDGKRWCAFHQQTELQWQSGYTYRKEIIDNIHQWGDAAYIGYEYRNEFPNPVYWKLNAKPSRDCEEIAASEFCPLCQKAFEVRLGAFKEERAASKRLEPTATIPPPSAQSGAPLAHP